MLPTAHASPGSVLLAVRGISKSFDGVTVLRDVNLEFQAGTVTAVIGPNGCGKSTLVKILSGYHAADPGGEMASPDTGTPAHRAFVHQDLGLIPTLSVQENLALGRGYEGSRWRISWRRQARAARQLLSNFGVDIAVGELVENLSPAEQAMVAIARALASIPADEPTVLVLDEPTSSLPESQVSIVLQLMRRIADQGNAVILITHRLDEVLDVASDIVVLRDGRLIAIHRRAEVEKADLVNEMLGDLPGQLVATAVAARSPHSPRPLLSARGLTGHVVTNLNLDVSTGEVVGVTGLLGSGKSELGRLLFGAQPRTAGEITLDGDLVTRLSPRRSVRLGVSYLPSDRRRMSSLPHMDATENFTLPRLKDFRKLARVNRGSEEHTTRQWMDRVDVSPRRPQAPIATFSGGNQQKLLFAKWLRLEPRLLILDEPTQAVDVGAAAAIYRLVRAAADRGTAVLLLSSEYDDLAALCDRVLVLTRGRITAELTGPDLSGRAIAHAAEAA